MNVAELMVRSVVTCRPEDSVAAAAGQMWEHDIGVLPVVGGDGRVRGMITDRDICMATTMRNQAPAEISVGGVMSTAVFACSPNDALIEAEEVMRSRRVRRLPVIDANGQLVGILSLNDLAREARREQGRAARKLGGEEVTETLAEVGEPRRPTEIVQLAEMPA
jgi:CBS-domain-containing membrane protein